MHGILLQAQQQSPIFQYVFLVGSFFVLFLYDQTSAEES